MSGRYDDIIHLERPASKRHPPMPLANRAAQFAPFAALSGYEAVIEEAARLTARQIELDEDAKADLNRVLVELAARTDPPGEPVRVKLTWFEPDGLKLGGAYRSETVILRRVDRAYRLLELSDRSLIEIDRVLDIQQVIE
ncbi:MAG: hypothetical protein J5789_08985 [Oscillospiraceae bacterium]|nr:hypothetical protein [Oscillospiraceae bacterium]